MSAETGSKRVGTRVDDPDLLERLEDAADEYGSRSEAIRAALQEKYGDRETVAEEAIDAALPDDPRVRQGYRVLAEESAPYTNRIDVDTAESRVANRLNIPSGAVRRRVIRPLKRHRVNGAPVVSVKWGVLVVQEPEDLATAVEVRDGTEETPSEELDKLADAGEAAAEAATDGGEDGA